MYRLVTIVFLILFFSSISSPAFQISSCQHLLDSGRFYLYESQNYSNAKRLLEEAKTCFDSNGEEIPGANNLYLAKVYYYLYEDSLSAISYLRSIASFEKVKDTLSLSKVVNSYGNLVSDHGYYDSAIYYFDQSILFSEASGNTLGVAIALNNKGNALKNIGKYDEALQSLYKSLEVYTEQEAGDKRLSISMLNIGALLDVIGKTDKALEFYKNSIALKKNINDSSGIARVYNNIGVIFKNQQNLDSAIYYYEQSKIYARKSTLRDIKWDVLINIGNIHIKKSEFNEAKKTFNESLVLAKNMQDEARIGETYYQLGILNLAMEDTLTALQFMEQSLPIIKKTKSFQDLKDLYEHLSEGYYMQKEYKKAYDFRLLRDQNNDSIYQESKIRAIEDIIEKYESEKKDKQLLAQKIEINEKQLLLQKQVAIIIILALIFIISIIWFINRRKKQQLLYQVGMNTERNRIAMDLHDHVGAELTLVSSKLDTRTFKAERQSEKEDLETISAQIRNVSKTLRETVWSIQADAITVGQLIERVQNFADKQLEESGIEYNSDTNQNSVELTPQVALTLFRICQEGLTNTLKYANATKAGLNIIKKDKSLEITLSDNGSGFDIEATSEGFGLINMRQRAEQIGASCHITSLIDVGTTITLQLDL